MDKSFIEKRIEERATAIYDKELKKLNEYITANPIGSRIKIENEPLASHHSSAFLKNSEKMKTIKEQRLKELIEIETDELLKRLETINYLFND